jgi:hypothetical protein
VPPLVDVACEVKADEAPEAFDRAFAKVVRKHERKPITAKQGWPVGAPGLLEPSNSSLQGRAIKATVIARCTLRLGGSLPDTIPSRSAFVEWLR